MLIPRQNAELVAGSLIWMQAAARGFEEGQKIDVNGLLNALEQDREAIESIMLCSAAQGRIADDILRYSKLSMGLLSISKSDFHLVDRISEVITMFSLESAQKQIQLSLSVGAGIEKHGIKWINADPHRLSQVLINFLTNALRFTVASAIKLITVLVEVTDSVPEKTSTAMRVGDFDVAKIAQGALWLTCSVIDSGRGLSQEDRAKLFERFAQANPKTDGVGGYGLGLFVSRKIVELHHGYITVESQEGAGSTFSFSVPVKKAEEPTEPGPDSQPEVAQEVLPSDQATKAEFSNTLGNVVSSPLAVRVPPPQAPRSEETPKGGHILIVEDNPINTKVLVRQMTNSGFTTTTAENGQVALDILLSREKDNNKPKIDVV